MTEQPPLPAACLSCVYFHAATSAAFPEVDGMCRRYAPQGPVIGSHLRTRPKIRLSDFSQL